MKGNPFIGRLRGKIGDAVASVQNGQQTYRSYNAAPKNPRSEAQVLQRSLFVDAVKFFTHGTQAFFKFAFENKSRVESDYNAFMRLNAKRGVNISKLGREVNDYPAIGNWIITQGSMPSLPYVSGNESHTYAFNATVNGAITTIAQLSVALVSTGMYQYGDICTILKIVTTPKEGATLPMIEPAAGSFNTQWIIRQFVLDANDNDSLSKVDLSCLADLESGQQLLSITGAGTSANDLNGCAIIFSRNTASGLKVSTEELHNSLGIENAIAANKQDAFVSQVLASWGASKGAILQGGYHGKTGGGDTPIPPTPTPKYTLTLSVNDPSLGRTTPTGTTEYNAGTEVQIRAIEISSEALFNEWSDGESNPTRTIVMDGNKTLVANFS